MLEHDVHLARPRWPRSSRSVSPSGVGVDRDVGAELQRQRRACSSLEAVAITRPAPSGRPSWTASEPTPPAAACTTTLSPSATPAGGAVQMPGGRALDDQRQRGAVVDPVGDREHALARARSRTRRSRRADERDHALARVVLAALPITPHLAARHERQRRLAARRSSCGCACRRSSAPARRDPDQHLARPGLGRWAARRAAAPPGRRTRSSGSRASDPRLSRASSRRLSDPQRLQPVL